MGASLNLWVAQGTEDDFGAVADDFRGWAFEGVGATQVERHGWRATVLYHAIRKREKKRAGEGPEKNRFSPRSRP